MSARHTLVLAAAAAVGSVLATADADAGWLWRRTRSASVPTATSVSSFKYSSGISKGEYERFRRLDNWYNEAYNGFRPSDFR